jgi:hypothetical protein
MRTIILSVLIILSPALALADLQWHRFGDTGDKRMIKFGRATVSIEPQEAPDASFPEDDLVLTLQMPNQKPRQYYFNSAYGYGAIAVYGDMLLIKYGVGRGTFARVDHIKALRLDYYLTELMDIQSSCYVLTDPHNAAPDLFEYQLKVQTDDGYTTFVFKLPKPQRSMPSEKIVKIKDDA